MEELAVPNSAVTAGLYYPKSLEHFISQLPLVDYGDNIVTCIYKYSPLFPPLLLVISLPRLIYKKDHRQTCDQETARLVTSSPLFETDATTAAAELPYALELLMLS